MGYQIQLSIVNIYIVLLQDFCRNEGMESCFKNCLSREFEISIYMKNIFLYFKGKYMFVIEKFVLELKDCCL